MQMHHAVATAMEDRIAEFDDMYIAECFDIINRQKPVIAARTAEEKAEIQARIDRLPNTASTI